VARFGDRLMGGGGASCGKPGSPRAKREGFRVVAVAMALKPEHLGRCKNLKATKTLVATGFLSIRRVFWYCF
jgi:hypothetical protein